MAKKPEIVLSEKDRDQYLEWMRELVAYCEKGSSDSMKEPTLLKYVESPEKLSTEEKEKVKKLEPLIGIDMEAMQNAAKKRKAALAASGIAGGVAGGVGIASLAGAGAGAAAGGAASLIGGGALAVGGLGLAVAPIAFAPLVLAGPVLAVLAVQSAKWVKAHKQEIQDLTDRVKATTKKNEEAIREKAKQIQENAAELHQKMQAIGQEYAEKAKQTAKEFAEFMKEAAEHTAINIDDLTHQNVNKRIQRYQEIALKQYRNQMEFEQKLYELTVLYNDVLAENERLRQEIAVLQQKNAIGAVAEGSLASKIKADKEA